MTHRSNRLRFFSVLGALALLFAGCSNDDTSSVTGDTAATPSDYATPLKGICPDTVVVQTNWLPEPDHGGTYQLIGPNGSIDAEHGIYRGPLGATGVQLEIRAGGSLRGFQPVSSLMAQDDNILLGYVGTDEAIEHASNHPTVGLFAVYERNPQIFMWGDPSWDFHSVADIGKANAKVLMFQDAIPAYVFMGENVLSRSQVDFSYDGGPSRFVTENGRVAQQGFVTHEPYQYEHEIAQWKRPVKWLLVSDEYPVYQNAISVRSDKLAANHECLEKLIPLFQQAQVDYVNHPESVNKFLLDYIGRLNTGGFTLSQGGVADAVVKMKELELVSNGADDTLGNFDLARVDKLIADISPALANQGKQVKASLHASDLVNNEFIDPDISLK